MDAGRQCWTGTPPPTVTSFTLWPRPGSIAVRRARRGGRIGALSVIFSTPAAAEAEGYRACRRCRPGELETEAVRRVREAQCYLEQHLDETVTLERLGRAVGMSPYHLQRTFKRLTGLTPRAYAGAHRMDQMKLRLKQGDTVSRATYEAGYSSASRAYDHSRSRLGMTPGSYQRGGRGVRIRFTTVPTALGAVLVAATDRGLCSVTLGDDPAALEAALRREYPATRIEHGTRSSGLGGRRSWPGMAGDEAERLPARCPRHPIPVAGMGGAATNPWRHTGPAVRRDRAGAGAALRGAGGGAGVCQQPARGGDPVSPRVVREDGGLGGYRWGMERKRELLSGSADRTGPVKGHDSEHGPGSTSASRRRRSGRRPARDGLGHSLPQQGQLQPVAQRQPARLDDVLRAADRAPALGPRADSITTLGRAPVPRCSSTMRTL